MQICYFILYSVEEIYVSMLEENQSNQPKKQQKTPQHGCIPDFMTHLGNF
jgi:hypothetical protein